jgi:hypothetical protein
VPENGIPYVLTGPDGSRAVFNDDTDPDFVGLLDGEKGITGLLDGADVRENGMDLVEGDGGVHGAFYLGRRSGTLEGIIWPDPDMTAVNAREQKLKRATRALRADAVLSWTPTGGTTRRLLVRRKERVAITARRPKEFQVQLVSASPRIEATTESNQTITPGAAAGEIGISSPISNQVGSGYQASGAGIVANLGDMEAVWRARITGPVTNPRLRNNTTGQELRFTITLQAGEYLEVNADTHAITFGAALTPRYAALDFANSDWWLLQPGANDIRLLSAAYSAGAQLDLYFRHAYE